MTADEALLFVREVLAQFRNADTTVPDAFFPFTESSSRSIIAKVQAKGELRPRSVMQAFSAVLESADLQIEARTIDSVSPDFAKHVLESYTFVSKDEETAE